MPIIDKLDPLQFYISFKLFRESTRSVSGKVVKVRLFPPPLLFHWLIRSSFIIKDISYLNRDLSKVIALDTNPEHYSAQPENSLTVPPWKGNPNDKGLIGLIPFLECTFPSFLSHPPFDANSPNVTAVAFLKPPDVRPILTAYAGKDVAIEYAKKEAENKRFLIQDWEKKREGKGAMVGGVSSLSRMFGASTSVRSFSPLSRSPLPLTPSHRSPSPPKPNQTAHHQHTSNKNVKKPNKPIKKNKPISERMRRISKD
jgi:import inner membrane translocase subunit TIM50